MDAMREARRIVALALANRAACGIKVRQPLLSLTIKKGAKTLSHEFQELIKEEVNVKEIFFKENMADEVELDTTITETLKKEGITRDLIRQVQDLRKQAGLRPGDRVKLFIGNASWYQEFFSSYQKEIMARVGAQSVEAAMPPASCPAKQLNFEGKEVTIGIVPVERKIHGKDFPFDRS